MITQCTVLFDVPHHQTKHAYHGDITSRQSRTSAGELPAEATRPLIAHLYEGYDGNAAKIRRVRSMAAMMSTYMWEHDEYVWCHFMNLA